MDQPPAHGASSQESARSDPPAALSVGLLVVLSLALSAQAPHLGQANGGASQERRIYVLTPSAWQPLTPPPVGPPPRGGLYHGVHPGSHDGWESQFTEDDIQAYVDAVGKEVSWVYFSHNWFEGKDWSFPEDVATLIRERGAVPFVRLMLRSEETEVDCLDDQPEKQEKIFTLDRIREGVFDPALKEWGKGAALFGSPVLVEWGTEANGCWFHWNGWWNDKSDGPERFRSTFRHIVSRVREGVTNSGQPDNITWVFHVNAHDGPDEDWNRFENYYPGDDVVDWVGLSAYGVPDCGVLGKISRLSDALNHAVPRLKALAPTKPRFLLEFGVDGHNPHAGQWTSEALKLLITDPYEWGLGGFAWWNEWSTDQECGSRPDRRVQNFPEIQAAFKEYLTDTPR